MGRANLWLAVKATSIIRRSQEPMLSCIPFLNLMLVLAQVNCSFMEHQRMSDSEPAFAVSPYTQTFDNGLKPIDAKPP